MSEHRRKGPSRFGRSLALGLVTAAIFLGLILGGAAWAGWTVTNNGLSLPKLRLDGILLGSMTEEEMTQALRDAGWDRRTELPLTVHFPLGLSMTLSRLDANAAVPAEDAARELMKLGHGTDWFENLSKYLRATFSSGYDVVLRTGGLNENYIRANLRSVTERFDALTGDPDLHLDTDSARLTMTKGGGALSLNGDRIFAFVSDALRGDAEEVSWTEMDGDVRLPDFNRVAADLCVEARDAAFAEDFSVIPEVVGCDFDIAEAEKAWREALPGTEVVIPLRLTRPAVTAADLESLLYRDRLCFMTTYYRDSTDNRKNNIRLAASKLDGITLLPGQVFSYNEAIGQRTEEAGFLLAGAYADGEMVEEIGGGICQVSSTLYCAAMYAQMTTVSRTSHYFAVGYLSMGYDATVSWKQPDYRFRNDRDYPVKIVAFCGEEDDSVTIEFWGTNTDGTHVSPYTTSTEVYDEEYPTVLIGYSVTVIRQIVDANDNIIDKIQEPTGLYHLHDQDIQWPPEKLLRDSQSTQTLTFYPAF